MNVRFLSAAAVLALAALASPATARASAHSGSCSIQSAGQSGPVSVQLHYEITDPGERWSWSTIADSALSSAPGNSQTLTFSREAGDFVCSLPNGRPGAAGTLRFVPNAGFAAALRSRGLAAPNEKEQFRLAFGAFKLQTLDGLLRGGFQRPDVADLMHLLDNGITDEYIADIGSLRFAPKTVDGLVRMRQHGVSASYAKVLLEAFPGTDADALVAARDHGVSQQYVEDLMRTGYRASLADLVRLRNHGVSAAYVERLRRHGYTHLSVEEIIRLRESGV